MKNTLLFLALACTSFVGAEEEKKVYVKTKNLNFSDKGIFLKMKCCVVKLPNIAFDYDAKKYYFYKKDPSEQTLLPCGGCQFNSYWQENGCCLNEDCPYYCF